MLPEPLQVYHEYSSACHIAAPEWEKAARSLSKWAGFGRINCCSSLQQRQLVLEMERLHGIDIHMQQLPLVLGLPEGCISWSCTVRWDGRLCCRVGCSLSMMCCSSCSMPRTAPICHIAQLQILPLF